MRSIRSFFIVSEMYITVSVPTSIRGGRDREIERESWKKNESAIKKVTWVYTSVWDLGEIYLTFVRSGQVASGFGSKNLGLCPAHVDPRVGFFGLWPTRHVVGSGQVRIGLVDQN